MIMVLAMVRGTVYEHANANQILQTLARQMVRSQPALLVAIGVWFLEQCPRTLQKMPGLS